ncbi:hypothetical protein HPTD01_1442 [Halomonas sp. TD01]|nr:hypothetical protein HPTD01_1442 [Halomonas sp. TD01]
MLIPFAMMLSLKTTENIANIEDYRITFFCDLACRVISES